MRLERSINISMPVRCSMKQIDFFTWIFFAEKPSAELIGKYANVIVDLLLSMQNYSDDFEFLNQMLTMIREILECDKSKYHLDNIDLE